MISQADLKTISTVFGKTTEEISGALLSEQDVSLDLKLNGRIMSQDDIAKIKAETEKQGKEIALKDVAKGLGVALEPGEKDAAIISEKFKTSLESSLEEKYRNQEPTEELTKAIEKAASLKLQYDTLLETHETIKGDLDKEKENFLSLQKDIKIKERNNKILGYLPEKINQPRNDALLIINNTLRFEEVEGKTVAFKGNEQILNNIGEPESMDNVIKAFAEEKKWVGTKKGMGGGDSNKDTNMKGMTPDKAFQHIKDKGIAPASPEGIKLFSELTKSA